MAINCTTSFGGRREVGLRSGNRFDLPDSVFNNEQANAARKRLDRTHFVSDAFDLNRLRMQADCLEERIRVVVNGEKIKLELLRSDCLKAIARLTLSKMETA